MTREQAKEQARAALSTIEKKQGVRSISGYFHDLDESTFVREITTLLLATEAACLEEMRAKLTKVQREAKWAMEWIDGRIYGQKIWHASKDPDYQRARAFLSQPEIQALEEQP